jgi:hypothetical protein
VGGEDGEEIEGGFEEGICCRKHVLIKNGV